MNNTIAIIGLGEIGTSLAMAFKAQKDVYTVIGCDYAKSAEKAAEEKQCVDRIEHNIYSASENADLVILAIPADQTRKTLELLGNDLRDEAIILDFCPAKTASAGWARQYLKHPDRFLGVWAGVNPDYLGIPADGWKTACADLFKGGQLYACPDEKTSEEAISLAAALADMLEMECAFSDAMELDGLIASVFQFPYLAANSLLSCLNKRSGWNDGKKAAGKTFYMMTSPVTILMDQEEPGKALLSNRENTVRILNEYIAELVNYRNALQNRDETGMQELIEDNKKQREQWEKDYRRPNLSEKIPSAAMDSTASDIIQQTFFGGFLRKKNRN